MADIGICTGLCTSATTDGLCHACGISHRAIRDWEKLSLEDKAHELSDARHRVYIWDHKEVADNRSTV